MSIEKNTEWMKNKLLESDDISSVIEAATDIFVERSFAVRINQILEEKGLSKSDVTKGSGLSTAYIYELFNGYKKPTRDRCILLGFGLKTSYSEIQELLKLCDLRELYPKKKREAVIIFCLNKKMSITETDGMLFELNEATLL